MRRWSYAYTLKIDGVLYDHFNVLTGFVWIYTVLNAREALFR